MEIPDTLLKKQKPNNNSNVLSKAYLGLGTTGKACFYRATTIVDDNGLI